MCSSVAHGTMTRAHFSQCSQDMRTLNHWLKVCIHAVLGDVYFSLHLLSSCPAHCICKAVVTTTDLNGLDMPGLCEVHLIVNVVYIHAVLGDIYTHL